MAGIVACGQTILDVIAAFWPAQIDHIPKEVNFSQGTRPYFYTNENGKEFNLKRLLSTTK
jgi:hypothetical protein